MIRTLAVFLILLFLFSHLFAGTTGKITGKIVDKQTNQQPPYSGHKNDIRVAPGAGHFRNPYIPDPFHGPDQIAENNGPYAGTYPDYQSGPDQDHISRVAPAAQQTTEPIR